MGEEKRCLGKACRGLMVVVSGLYVMKRGLAYCMEFGGDLGWGFFCFYVESKDISFLFPGFLSILIIPLMDGKF